MRNASIARPKDIRSRLASWRESARELGIGNAMLYWTDRILEYVSGGRIRLRKYLLVIQPLPQRLLPAGRATNIIVRELRNDDIARWSLPVAREIIEQRLRNGSLCLVAEIASEFVGYLWLHCGPYAEDEVRCIFLPEPPDKTAWDFDVYIEPHYRASRAFARLWDEGGAWLRARGYRQTASRISAFNPGSLRAHSRLGGHVVGQAIFIALRGVQLLISARAPFLRLTPAAAAPPEIRVIDTGAR